MRAAWLVIAATGCRSILGIDSPEGGGTVDASKHPDAPIKGAPVAIQTAFADPTNGVIVTVPFDKPITAGSLIVVAVGTDNSSTATSVTDTLGNGFDTAVPRTSSANVTAEMLFAAGSLAGLDTITVAFDADAQFPDVRVVEYGNVAADALDVHGDNTGNSTAADSGPITTHAPNELVVAASYSIGFMTTADPSFTQRVLSDMEMNLVEDRIAATPGSYDATAQLVGGGPWVMEIAAFRPR